jgi:flagellar hook protein FlgE
MFTSFNTALSALSADTTAIDVIGNNLANLNTPGYKASEVSFSDLVTQSLGAGLGDTQVGFGVAQPITIRQFSQGAIQSSSGPLDVAIQGDGFLVVNDAATNSTLYTRGGNLEVNSAGQLVTATGFQVQGWNQSIDAITGITSVVTTGPTSNVIVPVGSLTKPQTSTSMSFNMNLNASAVAGSPAGTFATSIQVYDSLGVAHTVQVTFTKTATPGQWTYTLADTTPGDFTDGDPTGAKSTDNVQTPAADGKSNVIQFDQNGKLQTPAATDPQPTVALSGLSDNATPFTVTWNLYNQSATPPTPQLTDYSQPSSVSANDQDGKPSAQLTNVGINNGGQVVAKYSDGQQITVAQLAMANIANPESLIADGNNNYLASSSSALPAVGVPNTGGRGQILGGSVENSTTDIAKEFTNLIVFQRAYEANSKVITTTDTLSQDTIGLIR